MLYFTNTTPGHNKWWSIEPLFNGASEPNRCLIGYVTSWGPLLGKAHSSKKKDLYQEQNYTHHQVFNAMYNLISDKISKGYELHSKKSNANTYVDSDLFKLLSGNGRISLRPGLKLMNKDMPPGEIEKTLEERMKEQELAQFDLDM